MLAFMSSSPALGPALFGLSMFGHKLRPIFRRAFSADPYSYLENVDSDEVRGQICRTN